MASRPWIARVALPLRAAIVLWRQAHESYPVLTPVLWGLEEFIFRDLAYYFCGDSTLAHCLSITLFALLHHDFKKDALWTLALRFGLTGLFDSGWGGLFYGIPKNYLYHYSWNMAALIWNQTVPAHGVRMPLMSLMNERSYLSLNNELQAWKNLALQAFGNKAPEKTWTLFNFLQRPRNGRTFLAVSTRLRN